jgi:uncharacterized protein (TIGR04255 family)
MEARHEMRAELRVQDGGTVVPLAEDLGFYGLIFKTDDQRRIAQFRRDGFTLNQLAPYTNAEALIAEAMRLWALYRAAVEPSAIVRVAFRYINSLSLPYAQGDDFRRFLTAPPDMPDDAPQSVSSFLNRVVAHDGEDTVILTQRLESAPARSDPVTLDIDVFRSGEFSPDGVELVAVLQRLRELKNRVFFASLTEEAVELFV